MPTLILVFFWIIVIWLLIFLFYLLKKYLGRIIIICAFVLLLYGIYWIINPAGARGIFNGIISLPTTTIRAINGRFSKDASVTGQNNQEIWSLSGDMLLHSGTVQLKEGVNWDTSGNAQLAVNPSPAQDAASQTLNQSETIILNVEQPNHQVVSGLIVSPSVDQYKIGDNTYLFSSKEYKVSASASGDILVQKLDASDLLGEDEDDGSFDIIPSNPKKSKKSDSKTTDNSKSPTNKKSSGSLSASDLNEASQIFNF